MTAGGWRLLLVAGVVATFAVRRLADLLNLRALDATPEPDLAELAEPERRARAAAYTRAQTRFGWVVSTAELAGLLLVWLGGGFGWLDGAVRTLALGPVGTGVAFLAALGLAQTIAGLPARWWATFVLEARFGFNRTTPWTFWRDTLLGLGLTAVLGGPLLAFVLWLFERLGDDAWWACWAAGTAWLLVVQYVAPTWLMPLFLRFAPLPEGPLRDELLAYARRVGFPLAGVWVVDGSRRSSKANAFFTGFGARKRIALFDTLLSSLTPDEVLAVVAHEVGHYRRHHVPLGIGLGLAHLGVATFVLSRVLATPALVAALGFDQPSTHAALVAFAVLLTPVELPLGLAMNALSRRHEYAADRFAAETTATPLALARALRRLATDTLANATPHPLYVALHYSHPPVAERVRALGAGGASDVGYFSP